MLNENYSDPSASGLKDAEGNGNSHPMNRQDVQNPQRGTTSMSLPMETQEIINILTAHDAGKTIQIKDKVCQILVDGTIDIAYACEMPDSDGWYDVPYGAVLRCIANQEILRIKPETKLRPYKTANEFIEDQPRHGWYVVSPDELEHYLFNRVTDSGIKTDRGSIEYLTFDRLLAEFKWQDGSPCGIVE